MIDTKNIQYIAVLNNDGATVHGTLTLTHEHKIDMDETASSFVNLVNEAKKSIEARIWNHAYGELVVLTTELFNIAGRVTFSDDQARLEKLRARINELFDRTYTV